MKILNLTGKETTPDETKKGIFDPEFRYGIRSLLLFDGFEKQPTTAYLKRKAELLYLSIEREEFDKVLVGNTKKYFIPFILLEMESHGIETIEAEQ